MFSIVLTQIPQIYYNISSLYNKQERSYDLLNPEHAVILQNMFSHAMATTHQ